MQAAVWGAGHYGQFLTERFSQSDKVKIVCYVDNAVGMKRDLPVISGEELKNKWEKEIDEVLIAVSDYYAIGDIILQLHDAGIFHILVAKPELWNLQNERWNITIEEIWSKYVYDLNIEEKAVITKLEYHVCDMCNLNCKGGSHFAPIFNHQLPSIDDFRKDMNQLSKRFSNILRLRLMGGDPFLNKELPSFIKEARKAFPYSNLEIVTNGLLLETADRDIWNAIKECSAVLQISLYPPTYAIQDKLVKFLKEKDVAFSFGSGLEQYNDKGIIEEFHKNLTKTRVHNPEDAVKYCMGNRCHYLRDGKISKCALPLLASKINQYFGTEYIVEQEDIIDIYEETLSAWDIVEKLHKATPFCGYCITDRPVRFPWTAHEQIDFSDYVI